MKSTARQRTQKKSWIAIAGIVGVLLIILIIAGIVVTLLSGSSDTAEASTDIDMEVSDDGDMSEMVPELVDKDTALQYDTDSMYWINITDVTEEEFADYVSACKEVGFDVDTSEDSSWSYVSSNSSGYELQLIYNVSTELLYVIVNAPEA